MRLGFSRQTSPTGSPNQAFLRRITSDAIAFQLYGRSGLTLSPSITAASATVCRICIARGNSSYRDGIGDFDILTIGRVATSFFSGTFHNLLVAQCNDEANYLASIGAAGAVSWVNL